MPKRLPDLSPVDAASLQGTAVMTVRITHADRAALERIARARRQATGENVSLSDLVRDAVGAFIRSQDAQG